MPSSTMVITQNDLCKNTCFTNMLISQALRVPRNDSECIPGETTLLKQRHLPGLVDPKHKFMQQKQTNKKNAPSNGVPARPRVGSGGRHPPQEEKKGGRIDNSFQDLQDTLGKTG